MNRSASDCRGQRSWRQASKFVVTLSRIRRSPTAAAGPRDGADRKEVDCLMTSILVVGEGDLAQGVVKAFEQESSMYRSLRRASMPARFCRRVTTTAASAIRSNSQSRFLGGNQEFPPWQNRGSGRLSKASDFFQLTIDDVNAVAMGQLIAGETAIGVEQARKT